MGCIEDDIKGSFNTFLNKQREEQGKTVFDLFQFSDEVERLVKSADLALFKDDLMAKYTCSGCTALNDAVCIAIDTMGKEFASMPEEERPEKIKRAIEMIASLTDAARASGIILALENLPRTCLCRTHDEMEAFLAAIPDLRVCFDTNHNLSEPNADYIRAVGDKIVTLHISDYDFVDEKHWFPLDGGIDWRELLAVLEEVNYTGRFTYETMPEGKTYEDLANNYNTLMNL
jgi:sugar phosphate isomerase/epimerase